VPAVTPEAEEGGDFNWLVALAFLVVALGVAIWLVTRFSRGKAQT
jgi:hypothetical protein